MDPITSDDIARFWAKVEIKDDPDSCWPWLAGKNSKEYGSFKLNGKTVSAHKLAYFITFGDVPKGLLVCHECGYRICCNPNHLFSGTHADNVRDMLRNGRGWQSNAEYLISKKATDFPCGGSNPASKLTEIAVIRIRKMHRRRMNPRKIAEKFNVCPATIRNIILGKTWKQVK